MLKGTCPNPKCGKVYYGWALCQGQQICDKCGATLIIEEPRPSKPTPPIEPPTKPYFT